MVILLLVAVVLILIICIATIVYFRGKYKAAIARKEEAEEKLRQAANEARAAVGQRPIPGSGVDMAARPPPPEPPLNTNETGRRLDALTQPRPRPRPRPRSNPNDPFAGMFDGLSESMNNMFNGLTESMNTITESASRLVGISSSIAQDAQDLLDLGVRPEEIDTSQTKIWNLNFVGPSATRRLRRIGSRADHPNWSSLVRQFMSMIESGELVLRNNQVEGASMSSRVVGQQSGTQGTATQQGRAPEPDLPKEEKKLPPTRFEREDVI